MLEVRSGRFSVYHRPASVVVGPLWLLIEKCLLSAYASFDKMKENSSSSRLLGGQCVLWIFLLSCMTSGVGALVFMS